MNSRKKGTGSEHNLNYDLVLNCSTAGLYMYSYFSVVQNVFLLNFDTDNCLFKKITTVMFAGICNVRERFARYCAAVWTI
jgi:hypothetical protein